MKRLLATALLALSSIAFGATLYPIQLLNPAGSTTGQVVASTGASTAPAWTTVTLSGLPGTVAIANGGTGAVTAAAALANLGALPAVGGTLTGPLTVSASGSAININDSSGTNVANLAFKSNGTFEWVIQKNNSNNLLVERYVSGTYTDNPISIANSTGVATFSQRPVFGTATPWDSANLPTPSVAFHDGYTTTTTGPTGLVSGTTTPVASLNLAAGTWEVSGICEFAPAASTTTSQAYCGISTNNASLGSVGQFTHFPYTSSAGVGADYPTPIVRLTLASSAPVYLMMNVSFTGSTANYNTFLRAHKAQP